MLALSEIRNNSSNFKNKFYKLLSVSNAISMYKLLSFAYNLYLSNALPTKMLNSDYHSKLIFRSLIRINLFENKISRSRYAFDWKSHLQRRVMDNIRSLIWVTRNIVLDQGERVQINSMIASTTSRERQLL